MVWLMAPVTLVWPLPLQTNDVRPLGTASLTSSFFNDPATAEIYALSLHDALPISTEPMMPVIDEPPTLSTLVTPVSFCGVTLAGTAVILVAGMVSFAALTVTVLDRVPVAEALTVAVTV